MKKLLRNPFLLIISLFAVVLLTITSATLAKYYTEKEINNNQTTADKFYFTVDILGDTNTDDSLNKTFNLYGEGEKVFSFKVQNFFDSFRITESAITYSVSLTCSDNEYTPTLTPSSVNYSFTDSKEAQSNNFDLTLPYGYKDNTTVIVDITSTSPYTKQLSLVFVLHTYDYEVSYYIEDTAKSPYASLVITSYVDIPVGKLVVDWSLINVVDGVNKNLLQVDTSNPYLLDNIDGVLTLQTNKPAVGTYMTSFVNTIAINGGEAIKINFFKSDASLDYTKSQVIIDDVDGTYTITLN